MSCARVCPTEVLCEGECVLNELGGPAIHIGQLQRYATDIAFAEGWRFFEAGASSGKSVGLVGGGPASLAAAHALRVMGHACTIYERRAMIGGLTVTGIAPYKIRADRAAEEVEWLLKIGGIEVQTEVEVGEKLSLSELESRHDALFFGFGLGPDSRLSTQGEELEGIQGAVAFIEEMKLGPVDLSGVEHALVIGGGNTAVDASRELLGLGVQSVSLVYRGGEAAMKGYSHEWAAAKQAGAQGLMQVLPLFFKRSTEGHVQAVRCIRTDAEKRVIEGTEFDLKADLVLLAIGQSKLGRLLGNLGGIELEHDCVQIDEQGATGRPGYFAGGDCVNGGKEVVNAAQEGKRAATAIHAWLQAGQSLKGGAHA